MNVATGEPGPGHVFTVLATTQSPDKIVEVGDEQTWDPDPTGTSGKLLSTRDPLFWGSKVFNKKGDVYIAQYTEAKQEYTITLTFRRGIHMTAHSEVWMIFGARDRVGACDGNGDGENGPPTWGGQNAQ